MDNEVLRRAVIHARCVDAHSVDFAPHQKLRGVLSNTGKMKVVNITRHIAAQVLLAVGPILAPPRAEYNDGIRRNRAVFLFPGEQVLRPLREWATPLLDLPSP